MGKKSFVGHALALVTAIIWGVAFVATKNMLGDYTPLEILLLRFIIGYVMLWILYPHPMKIKRKVTELNLFLAGFTGVTLYFVCENTALEYTYASNVSLLVSAAPIFTGLLAMIFLKKEKMTKNFVLGFICAMIGILLIGYNGSSVLELNPLGDLLALGAAICWAVYSIFTMKADEEEGLNTLGVTRRIFFYGILTGLPVQLITDGGIALQPLTKMTNWTSLLLLAVFASALGYVAWNKAMLILGTVRASAYIYFIPAVTMIASWLVLKEKITYVMIIGALLILGGLILSEKKQKGE